MKTTWIPTNQFYRDLIAEPDARRRTDRYVTELVAPWQQMMAMMTGPNGAGSADELAGARTWSWLLPDQTAEMATLLDSMEAAEAWQQGAAALEDAFDRFAPWQERIPFDHVIGWLVLGEPAHSDPLQDGYTGATDWFKPRIVAQFWSPNPDNLRRLPGLVAHELHHLVRLSAHPFGPQMSVADYVVLEGTAEAFAAARYGEEIVGSYVTGVAGDDLAAARRLIGEGLDQTGFDTIRSYMFGDAVAAQSGFAPLGGMPAFGGYAVGYHLVRAFLERTGMSIEEATFLPAAEIVAGSGQFN